MFFFFSSRRRHTRFDCDWSSDVCSSDLAGTARFASPLGTEDFVKRSSVIEYSLRGLAAAAPHLRTLTRIEGIAGHGSAAELQLGEDPGGRECALRRRQGRNTYSNHTQGRGSL